MTLRIERHATSAHQGFILAPRDGWRGGSGELQISGFGKTRSRLPGCNGTMYSGHQEFVRGSGGATENPRGAVRRATSAQPPVHAGLARDPIHQAHERDNHQAIFRSGRKKAMGRLFAVGTGPEVLRS
jgi:hypothetical protein